MLKGSQIIFIKKFLITSIIRLQRDSRHIGILFPSSNKRSSKRSLLLVSSSISKRRHKLSPTEKCSKLNLQSIF
ncbi:hypothetical protein Mgra_00003850 [Meloidogyne graminicola]|uniref:Uncharacterized protein n=1 Tax=Meloidogyne graminicola TaxID=189291 RepID=A0A8S9ZSM8_9BILA|nr:hypothetical protein Mgra_00003850 [Meloidogyne graminicola]